MEIIDRKRAKPTKPRDAGKSLEKLILLSQYGVMLTKIENATRRIKGGSIEVPSPVDFIGCYVSTGRYIAMDAKQCHDPNRLAVDESKLKEHQRRFLVAYGQAGGVTGLIAENTVHRRLYYCPWWMLEERTPSLLWDQLVYIGESNMVIVAAKWNDIQAYSDGRKAM